MLETRTRNRAATVDGSLGRVARRIGATRLEGASEAGMNDIIAPLTIDFLTWLAARPRPYAEVMEAWRTSCPRLTVWEDAIEAGLVAHERPPGQAPMIALTARWQAHLAAHRGTSR
jgi:hypothetical protein